MTIDKKYLKEIYKQLEKEDKQEQEIHNFNDFINYIKESIISNIYYDFEIISEISKAKLFKEE